MYLINVILSGVQFVLKILCQQEGDPPQSSKLARPIVQDEQQSVKDDFSLI